MRTEHKNNYAEYSLKDGILFVVYKKDVFLSLEAAEEVVVDRLQFQNERELPIFCDIRGIRDTEKAARDFLAQEGSLLAKAVAYLLFKEISEVILQFYFRTSRSPVPSAVFTNQDEALRYLEQYK